jgi:hypothetical protein
VTLLLILLGLVLLWAVVGVFAYSLGKAASKPTPPIDGPGVVEQERY